MKRTSLRKEKKLHGHRQLVVKSFSNKTDNNQLKFLTLLLSSQIKRHPIVDDIFIVIEKTESSVFTKSI